jgi:ribose-phosphate pyrophosphokinase
MNFKIIKNDIELDYKDFLFPAGEIGVKLNAGNYKYFWAKAPYQTIIARIQNSKDLFELALIKDALERLDNTPINLFLPYIPYARQDRVCVKGEAFSLKVFANFINNLKFNKVTVIDPHSLVSEALFNNLNVISQFEVINKYLDFINVGRFCLLVSPDAGANKKTAEIAGKFEHNEFVRADKLRDLATGEIKETIVYKDDFKGKDVCIIDDLCEKGGTFIALAKILKQKNAGKVILYVTHGLFTGDINLLFVNGIDEIYTTDSYRTDLVENEKFHVMKLEERFKDLI